MRARRLNYKVDFFKLLKDRDDTGGITDTWKEFATEWVQLIPLKSEEKYVSDQYKTEVNHKVFMRYRADIKIGMKIVYEDRIFFVDAVINPYERRKELRLFITEVFNG